MAAAIEALSPNSGRLQAARKATHTARGPLHTAIRPEHATPEPGQPVPASDQTGGGSLNRAFGTDKNAGGRAVGTFRPVEAPFRVLHPARTTNEGPRRRRRDLSSECPLRFCRRRLEYRESGQRWSLRRRTSSQKPGCCPHRPGSKSRFRSRTSASRRPRTESPPSESVQSRGSLVLRVKCLDRDRRFRQARPSYGSRSISTRVRLCCCP
jgi:hypothetical protein